MPATECCQVNKSTLKYDVRFHSRVDLENVCLKISGSASLNPIHLDEGVFSEMRDISHTYPFIKWQYFGSEQGVMTNFPVFDDKEDCDKYDPRYRPFYVETATPEAKDVVLVVDISASMTGENLYIAKEAAKTVLDTMNPKDQVGDRTHATDYCNKFSCESFIRIGNLELLVLVEGGNRDIQKKDPRSKARTYSMAQGGNRTRVTLGAGWVERKGGGGGGALEVASPLITVQSLLHPTIV